MKKRIGIDVDGVMRDFCKALVTVIKKHYPEYLKDEFDETTEPTMEPDGGMITDWYLENNFNCTKKDLQAIYWYEHAIEIMGNGNPFKENLDKVKQWINTLPSSSYEWVCVTSQKEHARFLTLEWLGKHKLNFDRVVFAKGVDKWKVDVDWLIDDSPSNWKYWKDGRQDDGGFILLDRPYNQNIIPTHRVFNLIEAEVIIL